jgi:hypothetical protein
MAATGDCVDGESQALDCGVPKEVDVKSTAYVPGGGTENGGGDGFGDGQRRSAFTSMTAPLHSGTSISQVSPPPEKNSALVLEVSTMPLLHNTK